MINIFMVLEITAVLCIIMCYLEINFILEIKCFIFESALKTVNNFSCTRS